MKVSVRTSGPPRIPRRFASIVRMNVATDSQPRPSMGRSPSGEYQGPGFAKRSQQPALTSPFVTISIQISERSNGEYSSCACLESRSVTEQYRPTRVANGSGPAASSVTLVCRSTTMTSNDGYGRSPLGLTIPGASRIHSAAWRRKTHQQAWAPARRAINRIETVSRLRATQRNRVAVIAAKEGWYWCALTLVRATQTSRTQKRVAPRSRPVNMEAACLSSSSRDTNTRNNANRHRKNDGKLHKAYSTNDLCFTTVPFVPDTCSSS